MKNIKNIHLKNIYTLKRYTVFYSNYYSCFIKNKNVEHKTIRRKNNKLYL